MHCIADNMIEIAVFNLSDSMQALRLNANIWSCCCCLLCEGDPVRTATCTAMHRNKRSRGDDLKTEQQAKHSGVTQLQQPGAGRLGDAGQGMNRPCRRNACMNAWPMHRQCGSLRRQTKHQQRFVVSSWSNAAAGREYTKLYVYATVTA
jgi:hypothetical protein